MAEKKEKIEEQIEIVSEEQDLGDLSSYLKNEQNQPNTILVMNQIRIALCNLITFQPMLEIRSYSCCHKSCVPFLVQSEWLNLSQEIQRTFPSPNNKPITLTTLCKKRIQVLESCTMPLKMPW